MNPPIETRALHRCHGGHQGFYVHRSESCAGPMAFSAFVPPHAVNDRLPMLFYLSGLTCNEEVFAIKAGAQRLAAELGIVLVAPDTSPRRTGIPGATDDWDFGEGAGFYIDATEPPWRERFNMYRYVTEELPDLIAGHFPVDRERCGIFGHSMGGHGALVCGLRNPDRFRSISAFAPIVAPMQVPWGEKAFGGYLGGDIERWREYDACELVARHRHPTRILIDQGLDDGFLDEQLRPERFVEACERSGQAVELRRHNGYDHGYFFIQTFIEDHLRHHATILG
ncbi:MAG: S-formylglutathione hydrolase [Wenzhouxiangella sp.]|jgi:S-formylglutathione hydrolase|nr:S-formylglutathione hydrolase [Wenzhouxiangella sp.]